MAADSLLTLSGPGLPDYSARGLTQTLEPIEAGGVFARTINGALINLSPAQFRKYKSTISCKDRDAPALDGVWQGMILTVGCVAELGYLTPEDPEEEGIPERTPVEGSSRTESAWTYYRPSLSMMVISYTTTEDEAGAVTEWSMDLEEV